MAQLDPNAYDIMKIIAETIHPKQFDLATDSWKYPVPSNGGANVNINPIDPVEHEKIKTEHDVLKNSTKVILESRDWWKNRYIGLIEEFRLHEEAITWLIEVFHKYKYPGVVGPWAEVPKELEKIISDVVKKYHQNATKPTPIYMNSVEDKCTCVMIPYDKTPGPQHSVNCPNRTN